MNCSFPARPLIWLRITAWVFSFHELDWFVAFLRVSRSTSPMWRLNKLQSFIFCCKRCPLNGLLPLKRLLSMNSSRVYSSFIFTRPLLGKLMKYTIKSSGSNPLHRPFSFSFSSMRVQSYPSLSTSLSSSRVSSKVHSCPLTLLTRRFIREFSCSFRSRSSAWGETPSSSCSLPYSSSYSPSFRTR